MTSIFEGKLVRLRAVKPSDWEAHDRLDREDTEVARLTFEIWYPQSPERVQAWAEREATRPVENDAFRFQIETLAGELTGTLNTNNCNLRCGTFNYGLAVFPQHQRNGYASEAIRLVLRYYFQERRYQKCTAEVYSFNQPSIKLHERLGFTLEGRLRRMIYTGGDYHDALMYGITREEFEQNGLLGL